MIESKRQNFNAYKSKDKHEIISHQKKVVYDMEKQDLWKKRIAECESSGLSITQWCRENDINKNTLNYWRARFKKEKNNVVFAKLEEPDKVVVMATTATINIWTGQVRIEVSQETDMNLLSKIVRALSC